MSHYWQTHLTRIGIIQWPHLTRIGIIQWPHLTRIGNVALFPDYKKNTLQSKNKIKWKNYIL